jgi:Acyl-CoA carboxylase epsilon subunit
VTNNAAAVTENASETTGETAEAQLPHEPHEPHIQILKGQPTDEELAALTAVLGGVGGGAAEPAQPERTRWGLPVDRLRYAMSNYQRLTMQQMTHMKR